MQKTTIRDVAERAGVAISSVSRVLSNHPNVSADLRQRVEDAVQALGYERDFLARSLRSGSTSSIGFLVGTISNPIMADISARASEVLSAQGYAMLLVCSQNKPEADVDYLRFLARRQVSGLIVSTAAGGPDQTTELIRELALPTVMLDRDRPALPFVSAVQSDHKSGMEGAVEHLIENGHHRIAMIGGKDFLYPVHQRLAGYRSAFEEAGLPIEPSLIRSVSFDASVAYTETITLFRQNPRPTALIAAGNTILTGVLRALQELGIIVGQDLALVGCDDTSLAQLYSPKITVIERDLFQLGETAATLLLDTINQESASTLHLPTRLVIRESSLCLPNN